MAAFSLLMRRRIRSPRLRFVLVVILLLIALALALHLVAMADHTMMMLGACFALLAVGFLLLRPTTTYVPILRWIADGAPISPTPLVIARGRYPLEEGTVLLD
jgi:hypothetical protein